MTGIEIKQNISVLQCQTRRKIQFAMGGDCGGALLRGYCRRGNV